ncbi:MAG: hypothetical protein AB8B77_06420 [Alphaproteobacteria bacterium]
MLLHDRDEIAVLCGITKRTTASLIKKGVLPDPVKKDGKRFLYDAAAFIEAYYEYKYGAQDNIKTGLDAQLTKEKIRIQRARAENQEIALEAFKSKVAMIDDVHSIFADVRFKFQSRIQALPAQLAPLLVNSSDVIEAKEILTQAVSQALEDLASLTYECDRTKAARAD